jgi:S-DNA-T family DNA segregation ATPase FtsK/SpoIIIE
MGLAQDMAFATHRESAVIMRDKGRIGIQISRETRDTVDFNAAMFKLAPQLITQRLPIIIGQDYVGNYETLDLADEPHALIAGSTGSGKSMFILSMVCGLAVVKKPEDLQIIIVDSKQVDLAILEHLPHVSRVCRNALDLHGALDYLLNEMRRRNALMSGIARNIDEYNLYTERVGGSKLSRIVLVIDEFADIVEEDYSQAKAKVEPFKSFTRLGERLRQLAQLSRASGINIIAATQRPSVNITSGDLKVNLPLRIAFKLVSRHDSITVLREQGAENLLGQGDMLVQSSSRPTFRAHAPFVTLDTLGAILANAEGVRDTLIRVANMSDLMAPKQIG